MISWNLGVHRQRPDILTRPHYGLSPWAAVYATRQPAKRKVYEAI